MIDIKLIATDMDGTLLDDNKKINEEFWEIHKKITDKGIYFVVASGRQYYNIKKRFERAKNNVIMIVENGALVIKDGEEIYSKGFTREDTLKIIDIGRKNKSSNIIYCGKTKAYIEERDEKFLEEFKRSYDAYEIVEDLTKIQEPALKISICDLTGVEKNSYPFFKNISPNVKVAIGGKWWLDMTEIEVNKGVALQKIQELLNIKKSETMVFGDFLNDYELIQQGDYSFAMENGHPELKKIAKYNGGNNNEAGVIKNIKKFIL